MYKSASTYYRQARASKKIRALEDKGQQTILAADNFTEADRAVAEQLEAAELLREFLATEV